MIFLKGKSCVTHFFKFLFPLETIAWLLVVELSASKIHVKMKMFSKSCYKYKTNIVRGCRLGGENTLKVASSELYLGSLIEFVTGGHKM